MANCRRRRKGVVDEVERAKSKTKSSAWATVEHLFLTIKRVFGFAHTCYRGPDKNAYRLLVTCALTNFQIMRRRLLRVL